MSSLRDRPLGRQGPSGTAASHYAHDGTTNYGALPLLQERALELARALLPTQRAVLVRAITPDVLALGSPYAPASAEEAHVAATLAHPMVGLLWPETAGYVRAYRPTPLGRLVLYAYLLERVAGESLGAWPAEPNGRTDRKDRRARRWGRGR